MRPSPYRLPAEPDQTPGDDGVPRCPDEDLLVPLGIFWSVGLVRVVLALARSEIWQAEATVALGVVLGVPWLLRSTVRALLRRCRTRNPDSG
jgi:hypothetical protein